MAKKRKTSIAGLKKMREARLSKIATIGNFVAGSYVVGRHKCVNPHCLKCHSGEQHATHRLSLYKSPGKTKTVYIPVKMAKEVRQWAKQHKKLKKLIQEVSELNIRIIRASVSAQQKK